MSTTLDNNEFQEVTKKREQTEADTNMPGTNGINIKSDSFLRQSSSSCTQWGAVITSKT